MDSTSGEYRGIWVLVEHDEGRLSGAGARLLGVARALADQSGAPVTALLLGAPSVDEDDSWTPLTNEAIAYGADSALLLRDAHLAAYAAPAWSAAVATLAADRRPAVILLADGPLARDCAPRLARRIGSGLISGADPATLDLDPASGTLLATRREWSGRLLTTYAMPDARPQVVTVRTANALSPYYDDWRYGSGEAADLSAVDWPAEQVAVAALHVGETAADETPAPVPATDEPPVVAVARALHGARCVVVGGRGVGSAAGFARVQRLAAALGGEWAATAGAVEAGWAPPEREVGLYGTTVRPDLYIGCGVSGSPQHVVGMQQARAIVAVNTDPQAPIFRWAHYAVVADSNALLDHLLERLERA
ncbi:MAG TPA: electron transfer flavoprotein subunit alpha/FixB family protein [Chloroflexia bacterium]|nr:electron transfer flavoprotein subunit alpha/FixB family protein [Chloroflexia bacterium]